MFAPRPGKVYGFAICGKCRDKKLHIPASTKITMVIEIYKWEWGKSERYGFVCPDCVYEIVDANLGHIWISHYGVLGTAKFAG